MSVISLEAGVQDLPTQAPYKLKAPVTSQLRALMGASAMASVKRQGLTVTGLQIRCVFVYLRIEVVGKRSTLTDTVVKNPFVLGARHLSYANSFHNNRRN